MADAAFKLTKLVGESSDGIEQAVRVALKTSASRVRGQSWCQVTDIRASIDDVGAVDKWQVEIEVGFKVED